MFEYSSDSLSDYVSSFPTTPVQPKPIVFERVSDPNSDFDSIVPMIPNQQQRQSIQNGELSPISNNKPNSYLSTQKKPTASDPESESSKLPFITNIYIASITVVGLFLLFRMIQK